MKIWRRGCPYNRRLCQFTSVQDFINIRINHSILGNLIVRRRSLTFARTHEKVWDAVWDAK